MIQTNIHGLFRAVDKQIDLTVDQYRGNARAGELIVDVNPGPFQYAAYIGTAEGNLIQISTGNGTGGTVSSVSGNGGGLGFSLTGTVTTTGNITLTTPSVPTLRTNLGIGTIANVNLDGNVSNVLAGDGSWIAAGGGGGGTYGDSNVVSLLSSFGSNVISTNGNITAGVISSSNNGNGTNFKVGDDAWIGDINVTNTIAIRGQQNPDNGYIIFGNGDTTSTLGRSGTGPLTYNGDFTAVGNIVANNLGNVSPLNLNGNSNIVLKGDGTWGYTSKIVNGGSYVDIPSSNGNVDIVTGAAGSNINMAVTTAFGTANVIKLHANGTVGEANISAAYVSGVSNLGTTVFRANANVNGNLNVVGTLSNVIRRAYGFKASDQAVTLDGVEAKVLSTSVAPFKLNVYVPGATSASGWTENFMNNTSTIQTWAAVAVGGGSGYEMSEAMTDEGWGCKATFTVDATRTFQITVVKAAPGPGGSIWSITIERLV